VLAFGFGVVKTQSGKLFSFCQAQILPFLQTHFVLNLEQTDSQIVFFLKELSSLPLHAQFVEKNGSGGQNSNEGAKDVVVEGVDDVVVGVDDGVVGVFVVVVGVFVVVVGVDDGVVVVVVVDFVVGFAVSVGNTHVVVRNGSVTVVVPSSNRFQAGFNVGFATSAGAFVASSRMLTDEIFPDE